MIVVYDELYTEHLRGVAHPETSGARRGGRRSAWRRRVCSMCASRARDATDAELELVHPHAYLERVKRDVATVAPARGGLSVDRRHSHRRDVRSRVARRAAGRSAGRDGSGGRRQARCVRARAAAGPSRRTRARHGLLHLRQRRDRRARVRRAARRPRARRRFRLPSRQRHASGRGRRRLVRFDARLSGVSRNGRPERTALRCRRRDRQRSASAALHTEPNRSSRRGKGCCPRSRAACAPTCCRQRRLRFRRRRSGRRSRRRRRARSARARRHSIRETAETFAAAASCIASKAATTYRPWRAPSRRPFARTTPARSGERADPAAIPAGRNARLHARRRGVGRRDLRVCASCLGALLLVAGILKAHDGATATATSIAAYRILPPNVVAPLGVALAVRRDHPGRAISLAGLFTRAAAIVASVQFAVFAGAVASLVVRHLPADCGCFGSGVPTPPSWGHVGRRRRVLVARRGRDRVARARRRSRSTHARAWRLRTQAVPRSLTKRTKRLRS